MLGSRKMGLLIPLEKMGKKSFRNPVALKQGLEGQETFLHSKDRKENSNREIQHA